MTAARRRRPAKASRSRSGPTLTAEQRRALGKPMTSMALPADLRQRVDARRGATPLVAVVCEALELWLAKAVGE